MRIKWALIASFLLSAATVSSAVASDDVIARIGELLRQNPPVLNELALSKLTK